MRVGGWGFGFRVSGFGFRPRVAVVRLQASEFGFRGFGVGVPPPPRENIENGVRVWGFRLRAWGCGLGVLCFRGGSPPQRGDEENVRVGPRGIARASGFPVLSSGHWDSGFGFRLQASGFGLQFRVPGFGIRVSGVGCWSSGSGLRNSGLGLRVSGFGFYLPHGGLTRTACALVTAGPHTLSHTHTHTHTHSKHTHTHTPTHRGRVSPAPRGNDENGVRVLAR